MKMLKNPSWNNSCSEIVNYSAVNIKYSDIRKETEKAYNIGLMCDDGKIYYVWLPKSQTEIRRDEKVIIMPNWLAEKKLKEQ